MEPGAHKQLSIAKRIMLLAAIYNLIWGAVISLAPGLLLFGAPNTEYSLILIRCIAMFVGTFGIAYYFCYTDPLRYWPMILVGLIGKVLGPLGALFYIASGSLDPAFLWVNLFNDFIWIPGFLWILIHLKKGSWGVYANNTHSKGPSSFP